MHKLSTIQKRENLNTVYATDGMGPGGANHVYTVCRNDKKHSIEDVSNDSSKTIVDVTNDAIITTIKMQCGPRKDPESTHGLIDSDLLEIVRDRLIAFQNGPFECDENAHALAHIEEALMWMNRRVEDRIERNVLGTNTK